MRNIIYLIISFSILLTSAGCATTRGGGGDGLAYSCGAGNIYSCAIGGLFAGVGAARDAIGGSKKEPSMAEVREEIRRTKEALKSD